MFGNSAGCSSNNIWIVTNYLQSRTIVKLRFKVALSSSSGSKPHFVKLRFKTALLSSSDSKLHYLSSSYSKPHYCRAQDQSCINCPAFVWLQLRFECSIVKLWAPNPSKSKEKLQMVCSFSIQYSFTCSMPACPYLGCSNVVSWKPFSVWFIVRPELILDCKCGKCQRWYLLIT